MTIRIRLKRRPANQLKIYECQNSIQTDIRSFENMEIGARPVVFIIKYLLAYFPAWRRALLRK